MDRRRIRYCRLDEIRQNDYASPIVGVSGQARYVPRGKGRGGNYLESIES